MSRQKRLKFKVRKAALGLFFVVLGGFLSCLMPLWQSDNVWALPDDGTTTEIVTENETEIQTTTETENGNQTGENGTNNQNSQGGRSNQNGQNNDENDADNSDEAEATTQEATQSCEDSLGAIGWLVCPTTGKLAEAVDWLYERLEGILILNPVRMEDGSPIYEIWKYALGLTNVVFVIFLLIVIYSQITGVGISNYGIKRSLPKLIVMAILVNLSFLICSVAVDVSNIVGMGIRQTFQAVEDSVAQTSNMSMHLGMGGILEALGGAGLAIGATVIAFETGAIWMLIPVVLGAIVAVVVGLLTIAMRQAVVALLVMISPLAMVMAILPNTEQWFNRWKQLFIQMLVFYPMFSLLFGASALAGFAIITSATDGFGLILGVAVQTFPLFFAWQLMKMSGTFLETVNSKMRAITAKPLGAASTYADRRRQLSMQKHLAGRAYTPSMRLMQFMSNRRVAQEDELSQHQQTVRNRGLAHRAQQNYRRDGRPSRKGERTYAEQAQNLNYQRAVLRDQNNMNRGLGVLAGNRTPAQRRQAKRLAALDNSMVNASDYLKAEQSRGEKIDYDNALSYQNRMTKMVNAHIDYENGMARTVDANGNVTMTPRADYRFHSDAAKLQESADLARYNAINQIMDGSVLGTQLVAATAAQSYDTQRKIRETKMQKVADLTAPTRDVDLKLKELTTAPTAVQNIDSIVAGLRILNQRGDLDLVRQHVQNVLDQGVEVGTHASQALGNFLMFEVNGGDPFLRRFGKYINLETAMVYSANKRKNPIITMDEMVRGEYEQINPETGQVEKMKPKMGLPTLMLGTPLDSMERKAMDNLEDMLRHAYTDENGHLDIKKYLDRRREVESAMSGHFISASLKFLSGSDQIKALVKFLTGYDDGKARWAPGGDLADEAEYAEKYFRDQTLKYLTDQTPTQLLGLRSDYYEPLMEHLSTAYSLDEMEDWTEEERAEREEMLMKMAEIQTKYGDAPTEEQMRKRQEEIKKLKDQMAAAEFRRLLEPSGKLEQIYRTRRSGAANNAKDWVRRWLNLEDEGAINDKLRELNDRRRERHEQHEAEAATDAGGEMGGFTAADRQAFVEEIQARWDDWHYHDGADIDAFYRESAEYVQHNLRDVGELILRKYDSYRRAAPYATAEELRDELQRLINDPDNY